MKKLFGDFLVERSLITKNQLTEALVEQLRGVPHVATLAFDDQLIESEELYEILKLQQSENIDFISALKTLQSDSESVIEVLRTRLMNIRKPLGQILVERGFLTLEKLTSELDEFLVGAETKESSAGLETLNYEKIANTFDFLSGLTQDDEALYLDILGNVKRSIESLRLVGKMSGNNELTLSTDKILQKIEKFEGLKAFPEARVLEGISKAAILSLEMAKDPDLGHSELAMQIEHLVVEL